MNEILWLTVPIVQQNPWKNVLLKNKTYFGIFCNYISFLINPMYFFPKKGCKG